MKKMLLTLRSALLLLLLLGTVPIALGRDYSQSTFIQNGINYQVTSNSTVKVVSYWDQYSGDIVIPSVVKKTVTSYGERLDFTFTVTAVDDWAFGNCAGLTSIKLPGTVKTIGKNAFYDCTSLTSVTLANGLDSIKASAFNGCTALQSIVLPNSVHFLDWNVFYGCTALTHVTLSNHIKELNGTFFGCSSLESVILPPAAVSLDGTFTGCSSLKSVIIPNSVTHIGEKTFLDCSELVSAYIPNSVVEIGEYAFSNTGLSSIVIPGTVSSIGEDAFLGCSKLTSVTSRPVTPPSLASSGTFTEWIYNNAKLIVPQVALNTYRSSDWWNLFKDITGNQSLNNSYDFVAGGIYYNKVDDNQVEVTYKDANYNSYSGSVTIPATVTNGGKTYNVTNIGYRAFYHCTGLTSVTLPTSMTTIAAGAFNGCVGLTSLTIPQSITAIGAAAFEGCSGLTQLIWNAKSCWSNGDMTTDNITKVTIGNSVETLPVGFVANSKINSVNIPSSVKNIGKKAFNGCASLTSITIPKSVSTIGDKAFADCSGLTSLTWNAQECWFNGDMTTTGITQVNIGNEVQVVPIGFAANSKITSVNIPNSVKAISGEAFYKCNGITSLTLPNDLETIGGYAFYGLSGITNLTIPSSVMAMGYCAFGECNGLTSLSWNAVDCFSNGEMPTENISQVTIGNQVKTLPESFISNSKVTSINIPNTVEYIGSYAFSGCTGLTSIVVESGNQRYDSRNNCNAIIETASNTLIVGCNKTIIPNSVTSIGSSAFYGCTGLTSVTIPNAVTSIGSSAFSYCI